MKPIGLVLTDWLLFNRAVDPRARTVVGTTLRWNGRNPSLTTLEELTGMRRHSIIEAQRAAESSGVARYRRPKRHPDNEETNKLAWLHDRAQPIKGVNWYTVLDGDLLAGLPRGRGVTNAHLYPLLLALYAYEQRRRGAIQMEDAVAATMLGLSERQIERLRTKLVKLGRLKRVRVAKPTPIYVIPSLPHEVGKLDPQKSPRMLPLRLGDDGPTIYVATGPGRREAIINYASRMAPEHVREAAQLAADRAGHGDPHGLLGGAFVDALGDVDVRTRPTLDGGDFDAERRMSHHLSTEWDTPSKPCSPLTVSTSSCGSRREDQTTAQAPEPRLGLIARLRQAEAESRSSAKSVGEARNGEAASETRPAASVAPRREWGGDYSGLWYFADDSTHAQIEAIIHAFETKHGREWATAELHTAIFGTRKLPPVQGDGREVLRRVERHSHLLPMKLEWDGDPSSLMDSIQIVPE